VQTVARNAAEIVALIEGVTEVEIAVVAPAAEAVAGDVDAAAQAAVAAEVSEAADTAEAVTEPNKEKWRTGVPPVQPKGRETIAAFFLAPNPRRGQVSHLPSRAKLGQVPGQTPIDSSGDEREKAGRVAVDAQDVVLLKTVRLGGHFLPSRAKRLRDKSAPWKLLEPISTFAPPCDYEVGGRRKRYNVLKDHGCPSISPILA